VSFLREMGFVGVGLCQMWGYVAEGLCHVGLFLDHVRFFRVEFCCGSPSWGAN